MAKPMDRAAVERLVSRARDAYGLTVDETRWLIDQLVPPSEVEQLRAEVAELRALVGALFARPTCPHTPRI